MFYMEGKIDIEAFFHLQKISSAQKFSLRFVTTLFCLASEILFENLSRILLFTFLKTLHSHSVSFHKTKEQHVWKKRKTKLKK